MKLAIQLPALNESRTIGNVLEQLPQSLPKIDDICVIVVDDGSSDETGRIAREHDAFVIRHEQTRGVGAAFRSGLKRSMELGADLVVTLDADGQFDPDEIPKLLAPILADDADCTTGSRFIDPALEPEMPRIKRWGNRFLARWISKMVGKTFYDVSCGFRAYSSNAFMRMNLLGDFTYTHEVFLSLSVAGLRLKEIPIRAKGVRESGKSRVASNLFRYAWHTMSIIASTYRDYFPLRFFGRISLTAAVLGTIALAFVLWHWAATGSIFPYKAVGFAGSALWGVALLVFLIGLLAEMHVRLRSGIEDLLFRVRRLEQQYLYPSWKQEDSGPTNCSKTPPESAGQPNP
jgi:glycosyltransferase involved in cell wall biosynthesis